MAQIDLTPYASVRASYTVQWSCPEYLTTPTGIPQNEEYEVDDG